MMWFLIRTRIYVYYRLLFKRITFSLASLRDGPIIVAVGDSWFNLTTGKWQSLFTVAIIDWLKDYYGYNIYNMAIPGYTFTDEIKFKLFKYPVEKLIKKHQHELIVLLSLGGNDVLFADVKKMITKKNDTFTIHEKEIRKFIKVFIRSLKTYIKLIEKSFKSNGGKNLTILIHGYGYVNIKKGGKNNKKNKNLPVIFDRYDIPYDIANKSLRVFIDIFNEELNELTKKDTFLKYIDLRKLVEVNEFMDDIHPTRDAFKKIADKYDKFLSKYIKK